MGIAAVVVVVVGLVVVVGGGDDDGGALAGASIRLEPVDAQTPDPFVDEDLGVPGEDPSVSLDQPPNLSNEILTGLSGRLASGSEPGLYGGSQDDAICDVQAQLDFLTDPDNADQARAWADVQGIQVDDIPQFVGDLTPVRLRYDTRVTNHSFADGEAQPFQSILQAGTAVLVDGEGVPRSRCSCGNPLTEPLQVEGEVDQARALDLDELAVNPDDAWEGFDAAAVVTVEPGDDLETVVLADLATGEHVEQLPGIQYTIEQLEAALPLDSDLDQESYEIERCPGGATCGPDDPGEQSVGVTGSTEGGEETFGFGDIVSVFGSTWSDPQARSEWLETRRAGEEGRTGQFDIPPEDSAGGEYSLGERGEGTLEDFEVEGWEGFIRVATFSLVELDGRTSSHLSSVSVVVVRGNASLNINVGQPGDDQAAVEDLARQHAADFVEALS